MKPASLCPRFLACSVNACPLDPAFPAILTITDDREKACPMEKNVRRRISSQFPGVLKLGGLRKQEATALARYEALSPAVKTQMAERGKARLEALRNSQRLQKPKG